MYLLLVIFVCFLSFDENLGAEHENDLAKLVEKLSKEVQSLRINYDALSKEFQDFKNHCKTIDTSLKKRLLPGHSEPNIIAFSAQLHGNLNLGPEQIVPYKAVITNVENAYDPQTGIFLAPAKGLYFFSVAMISDPNQQVHLDIMRNGSPVGYVYSHNNGWDMSTQTVLLVLEVGDRVWLKHNPRYDLAGSATITGEFNTFSGALLNNIS